MGLHLGLPIPLLPGRMEDKTRAIFTVFGGSGLSANVTAWLEKNNIEHVN